jgi:dihydrofolate reductase
MRKIVSGLFISLDGVVERPDQWHFPYFNDEMGQAVTDMTQNCDANLFGRKTFEEFASYWPQQSDDVPFASHINNVKKYVVSNTITSTDWNNSEIISGDVMAEIAKLKEQPGKDIGMTGSGTLVRGLLEAGLLDELHLLLHPIAVVNGKRLFEPGGEAIPLELIDSKVFQTGVVHLTYRKAAS